MATNPRWTPPAYWHLFWILVAIACAAIAAVGAQWPATELKVLLWGALAFIAFLLSTL